MNCSLLNGGISKGCATSTGGVSAIYLTDLSSVTGYTAAGGTVTSIAMGASQSFYSFEFNRNSAQMDDNATPNADLGSLFYDQTVTFAISRREVSKRNTIALLMNKDLVAIVKDQNGLYWLLGKENGLRVTELPSSSGKAKGDLNGYTFTLKGEEPEQAYGIDASAVTAVI